jgi:hypothetical protein
LVANKPIIFRIVCFVLLTNSVASFAMTALNPRCEDQENPLNVDNPQPVLSWKPASDQRGDHPTAYQVLVASTPERLAANRGDLWDSGKVVVDSALGAIYAGSPLNSCQAGFWKVRLWDRQDQPGDFSASAAFGMGQLSSEDWSAKWIGESPGPTTRPLPIFRRQFTVAKPLARATIYICGLGQFELHINGQTVSQDLLQPGWTDYRKTCLYAAYDVTAQLQQGDNALGIMLGNGMYNLPPPPPPMKRYQKFRGSFGAPKLLAELHLDYTDGTGETVITDANWKVSSGPITFSSTYGGEDYDARLEQPGWDTSSFNDASWTNAAIVAAPPGKLAGSTRSAPPIRIAQIFTPQSIREVTPGVWVYDLGQNCALIPRITVHGDAGTTIRLTPGEVLTPAGTVTQSQSGSPSYDTYILSGRGEETWNPRFNYYGSRYVQIEGAAPDHVKLEGLFITSTSPAAGDFSCSNDLFNRTNTLIRWAIRSNMVSILTDCPHREKLGWLEQDHLMGPSIMYNFDLHTLMNKICCDMEDAQLPSGLVPDIAPEYTVFAGGFRDSPEWGSAAVLLPWNLYGWYGDLSELQNHYDMMRRYVAYLSSRSDGGIVSHGLGDWYDLGPKRPGTAQLTPIALTATAFYYRDLTILQKTAALLGKSDDAAEFSKTADAVRKAFIARFYNAGKHQFATASQTSEALPLVFGLVPQGDEPKVLDSLVQDIRSHTDGLTAGDVGYRYVLRALADGGRSDVVFDMNKRSDRPGYGYQLDHGATSLTEAWNADPRSSMDHFMLGHIMEWFYSDLAGIGRDEDSIAFNHILIKPAPVGDVTWARAGYDSVRGPISSSWKTNGGQFTLDITIPPGATADVYIPAANPDPITESGKPAAQSDNVKFLRADRGASIFTVESGHYHFSTPFKNP